MNSPSTDFEQQPATKRDMADVKKELKQDIARVEDRIGGLEGRIGGLEETVKNGFEHMEELLGGPKGLIVRMKRVEEAVGIKPGQ